MHTYRQPCYWNVGKFCLWNVKSRALESATGSRNLESRIQVPLLTTGIQNLRLGIQNPKLSWIPFQEAILNFII